MAGTRYPMISHEIRRTLLVLVLLGSVLLHLSLWYVTLILFLLAGVLAWMFRDPERAIPSHPLAVISPVDGEVVSIATLPNPYIEGDSVCISLKMTMASVFRIRSPIEGKVLQRWFLLPGDPLPMQQGAVFRLQISSLIQSDEGDNVVLTMRHCTRRFTPRCDIQVGERIGQGQRCGIIPFGAVVDLYVPQNARITVSEGDRVKAGSDIVAQLSRHEE